MPVNAPNDNLDVLAPSFNLKNIDDERAPLADRFYGFFADAHQDYGRNYYLDFRLRM